MVGGLTLTFNECNGDLASCTRGGSGSGRGRGLPGGEKQSSLSELMNKKRLFRCRFFSQDCINAAEKRRLAYNRALKK